MACFPRISGYRKITFCRICNARMIDAAPGEYYCKVCVKKFKERKKETSKQSKKAKKSSKAKKR